jgi:hypothetical protein
MALTAWALVVVLASDGAEVAAWAVEGPGAPDLEVIDTLARTQLRARRVGGAIALRNPSKELLELLDLVGLRREVGGQAEGGEELLGVEEGVEPRDPSA